MAVLEEKEKHTSSKCRGDLESGKQTETTCFSCMPGIACISIIH